jgi:hypothetical protein
MGRHLPLLEAVAAVALIGAVAVLTALPGSRAAAPEEHPELQDGLGVLRTAIFRFSMDHDPGGRDLLMPGADGEDISAQLIGTSSRSGSTAAGESATGRDNRWYGPYLDAIPVNPVNGLSSIRSMPPGYLEPVFNGSAGWVYLPETGEIYPDLPGQTPAE